MILWFQRYMKGGAGMDIARLSMSMSASNVQNQVSIAVLSNALDMTEELGQGLIEIMDAAAMELSVNPGVGANFDIRI